MQLDLTYSTNVFLHKDDDRFQFVYGSQLYGTFFSIYAKFIGVPVDDHFLINKILVQGINYKGALNIDIENAYVKEKSDEFDNTSSQNALIIGIDVRATINAQPVTEEIIVDNLGSGISVPTDHILLIERKLKRMYQGNSSDLRDRAFVGGHFDSEFFVRDGLFIKDHQVPRMDANDTITKHNAEMMTPGVRCIPGVGTLKF
ncbi:MAG: hypothetical protein JXQ90_02525 [Cyclobacteriaceae bacterium]